MSNISDFATSPSPNAKAFLKDIATLGVIPAHSQSSALDYGVFGARSNDRFWLLPLVPRRATRTGLEMFQPASTTARLGRCLATLAMHAHLNCLWARARLRLSGLPELNVDFGAPIATCAYFTGTAGPHRKTAIQAMSADGTILGYGKLTRSPAIAQFLAAEASMLDQLATLKLRSAAVPRRIAFRTTIGKSTLLVTDSRKSTRARSPTKLGEEHLAFLSELDARTGQIGNLSAAQALINRLIQAADGTVSPEWRDRFRVGADLLRGRSHDLRSVLTHGDFTPWNVFIDREGLYVFDWEYAENAYPLGYDLARFMLSLPSELAIVLQARSVLDTMTTVLFNGEMSLASDHFCLSLLLHAAFYLQRAIGAGGGAWEEEVRYGALIDAVAQ